MSSHDKMKLKALCPLPPAAGDAGPRFLAVLDGEVVRLEATDPSCVHLTIHRDVEVTDPRPPRPAATTPGIPKAHPLRKDSDP